MDTECQKVETKKLLFLSLLNKQNTSKITIILQNLVQFSRKLQGYKAVDIRR